MQKPKISKSRRKWLILSLLTFTIGIVSGGIVLHFYITELITRQFRDNLLHAADIVQLEVINRVSEKDTTLSLLDRPFLRELSQILQVKITLMDTSGKIIQDTDIVPSQLAQLPPMSHQPEVILALQQGAGFSHRFSTTLNQTMFYYARLVRLPSQRLIILRVALPESLSHQRLVLFDRYIVYSGLIAILLAIMLLYFLSRKWDLHVQQLQKEVQAISIETLKNKLPVKTSPEIAEIIHPMHQLISALLQHLNSLEHDKAEMQAILSSISEGFLAIDEHKKIIFYNKIALDLLENTSGSILNEYYYDVIRNAHLLSLIEMFFEKPYVIQDEIETENNRILEITLNPLTPGHRPAGCVIVLRDITQYKKLEKIRRDFVANVSHEFKTPLAAIRGYAETLIDWALEDPQTSKKYVTKILRQSEQLENLVSDLLELARIERLQTIEMTPFYPLPIIKDIVARYQDALHSKQLDLQIRWSEPDVPILGEEEMFRSMLANLIDNAIKYTPEGGQIEIFNEVTPEEVAISVKDTGIGIPEKELGRIFERFFRVDRGRSREMGGTGLGLSIVKHLAELQKAAVSVKSEVGKGSCFTVTFLRAEAPSSLA